MKPRKPPMPKRWTSIDEVFKSVKLPRDIGRKVLALVFDEIERRCHAGERVRMPGVGTFFLRRWKPRLFRDIATKRLSKLPETTQLALRPTKGELR